MKIVLMHLTIFLSTITMVSGFQIGHLSKVSTNSKSPFQRENSLQMAIGDYFSNAFNTTGFLNLFSGNADGEVNGLGSDDYYDDDDDEDSEDDDEYLGCTNVFRIDGMFLLMTLCTSVLSYLIPVSFILS